NSLSAYERLENRFGRWSRIYAASFNVLYHIGRMGMILYGVSLAVSTVAPVPLKSMIVVIGVLVIVYTLLGGIEAVIWTDVLQSVILIGGILLCLVVLIGLIPGGVSEILQTASAQTDGGSNRLSLGSVRLNRFTFAGETLWATLLFGFVTNLQNFAADQTYVQRYFTASSQQSAQRSVWMGAIAYIPISAALFFIGTALFVYYGHHGELPGDVSSRDVLPWFIMHKLPAGVSGLLIAAILAAAMSTVDSSLNSSSTLLLCDGIRPLFPRLTDRTELRLLRLMTVLLGVMGISAALFMTRIKSILDAWWLLSGILSGGTLALILLARFSRIQSRIIPLFATFVGICAIAVVTLAGMKPADVPKLVPDGLYTAIAPLSTYIHQRMAGTVGTLTILAVAMLLAPFTRLRSGRRPSETPLWKTPLSR
ncbi:MAG: sodium:solute symporter, partial [Planctomycetaceae bacterium]|nr:sodium:solute symporter [Planctomycetaceae bacterium]